MGEQPGGPHTRDPHATALGSPSSRQRPWPAAPGARLTPGEAKKQGNQTQARSRPTAPGPASAPPPAPQSPLPPPTPGEVGFPVRSIPWLAWTRGAQDPSFLDFKCSSAHSMEPPPPTSPGLPVAKKGVRAKTLGSKRCGWKFERFGLPEGERKKLGEQFALGLSPCLAGSKPSRNVCSRSSVSLSPFRFSSLRS